MDIPSVNYLTRSELPSKFEHDVTMEPTAIDTIEKKLQALANPETAGISQRFFKTGPGEYGEGDVFLGIRVPALRKLSREYQNIPTAEAAVLLRSPIHEQRLLALFILIHQYNQGSGKQKKKIYELYLKNIAYVNNWDLVDGSAEHIVGAFLRNKSRAPLYRLAGSKNLWKRRIAILSTFHFIKHGEFADTLAISKRLLGDNEDLIHKAVGWMLREVGKCNLTAAEEFIKTHYDKMPRTTLRYAIERFPEPKRQEFLKGRF